MFVSMDKRNLCNPVFIHSVTLKKKRKKQTFSVLIDSTGIARMKYLLTIDMFF